MKKIRIAFAAFVLICILFPGALLAVPIYVAETGDDITGNGSEGNPYRSIAKAVEEAGGGDTILVSAGEYPVTSQILLNFNVRVAGADRDTTIVRRESGDTRIFNITHADAVVSGLTIRDGQTTGSGGGVYMTAGTLTNCLVIHNEAGPGGGGIYADGAGVEILNTVIEGNSSSSQGGGGVRITDGRMVDSVVIHNRSLGSISVGGGMRSEGSPVFIRCTFTANTNSGSDRRGGGIYGNGTFKDCIISYNSNGSDGGGIHFRDGMIDGGMVVTNYGSRGAGIYLNGSTASVRNCRIEGNVASLGGGGVWIAEGGPISILNCAIRGNSTTSGSGGIHHVHNAPEHEIARNCLIVDNSSGGHPGGVGMAASGKLVSCTIAGNTSGGGGNIGGLHMSVAGEVVNCIIAGNTSVTANRNDVYLGDSSYTNHFHHTCVQAEPADVPNPDLGNIIADPQFADADYRLSAGSLCVNTGIILDWMLEPGAADIEGRSRINRFSGRVDMGCYERVSRGTLFKIQ